MSKKVQSIVRVASYNLGDGPDKSKERDLNQLASAGAQLIELSEHGDRGDVTTSFVNQNKNWGKWAGDGDPGEEKICLLYRKDVGEVTARRSYLLARARRLAQGAGPENAGPKKSNHIRLRIRGRRVHLLGVHQYATVHKRLDAARLLMRTLVMVVRHLFGVVIIAGDFNQEAPSMPLNLLRAAGFARTKTGPTHGRRTIDFIWVRGAKILKSWTMKLSSDHKAVLADIKL